MSDLSSKQEIGELKSKLNKSEQMQKSKEAEIDKLKRELEKFTSASRQSLQEKEKEIAQLKERLAAFDKKEPPRKSDQIVKQGISNFVLDFIVDNKLLEIFMEVLFPIFRFFFFKRTSSNKNIIKKAT